MGNPPCFAESDGSSVWPWLCRISPFTSCLRFLWAKLFELDFCPCWAWGTFQPQARGKYRAGNGALKCPGTEHTLIRWRLFSLSRITTSFDAFRPGWFTQERRKSSLGGIGGKFCPGLMQRSEGAELCAASWEHSTHLAAGILCGVLGWHPCRFWGRFLLVQRRGGKELQAAFVVFLVFTLGLFSEGSVWFPPPGDQPRCPGGTELGGTKSWYANRELNRKKRQENGNFW